MARTRICRTALLGIFLQFMCRAPAKGAEPGRYFAVEVVDAATGRGVPMVELQTTYGTRYYTDSNGLVAFDEPGLMDRRVFFGVSAHGYEMPPDGFGVRGVVLRTTPGTSARVKIKRINIAERLYRVTGFGVYRDTVLLGRRPPVAGPVLNAEVTGEDGTLNALYRGKLYWFYGDTNRLSYILGNFSMTGATTAPPDAIDPSVGFELHYFTDKDGFARAMAPLGGEGVVWLYGVQVLPDPQGRDRMLAFYQRRRGLGAVLENGFVVYNDARDEFERLKALPLNPPIFPTGYPFRVRHDDGAEYAYFTAPYPALRVRADWASYLDVSAYEGFTCLAPGSRYGDRDKARLDRDAAGRLVWGWKKDTPPLNPKEQQELVAAAKMTREESPFRLQDAETGKPVLLNNCSCNWNDYRKAYVMIASEMAGATTLGEVWYSEADRPEGPWVHARKVITHANKPGDAHDFYNPVHHAFLDRKGGREIYLEGSYVNTFSGNSHPTPYYEYNQVMYRLDLTDPRLRMTGKGAPVPK
jgi:hypothetical protein